MIDAYLIWKLLDHHAAVMPDVEETTHLLDLRIEYLDGLEPGSLVAWTLSPEWLDIPEGRSQRPMSGEITCV
jgi:hypothetical protein